MSNSDELSQDPETVVGSSASDVIYADDPPIVIGNEFAEVRIRKVFTRNGERLEIDAYRRGYRIHLDAIQLESLTWQNPETFSSMLKSSLGNT